mgnify:FL=1
MNENVVQVFGLVWVKHKSNVDHFFSIWQVSKWINVYSLFLVKKMQMFAWLAWWHWFSLFVFWLSSDLFGETTKRNPKVHQVYLLGFFYNPK